MRPASSIDGILLERRAVTRDEQGIVVLSPAVAHAAAWAAFVACSLSFISGRADERAVGFRDNMLGDEAASLSDRLSPSGNFCAISSVLGIIPPHAANMASASS